MINNFIFIFMFDIQNIRYTHPKYILKYVYEICGKWNVTFI